MVGAKLKIEVKKKLYEMATERDNIDQEMLDWAAAHGIHTRQAINYHIRSYKSLLGLEVNPSKN